VSKLRIGYSSQVPDLTHPADRRRLVFWANKRGHQIITDLEKKVDVFVLSGRANFGSIERFKEKAPVVIDLIDGYLINENPVVDLARGVGKFAAGQLSGRPKKYSSTLSQAISKSDATICASIEQQKPIANLTQNSHVILDFHEEFPFVKFNASEQLSKNLLWEGQPYTVDGLKMLESCLVNLQRENSFQLNIVTDLASPRFLGRFGKVDTYERLGTLPNSLGSNLVINPWSIPNVISAAAKSDLSIIPLNPTNPLNSLKPENRLLIMWRLGIPCLTSPTLAYNRVMEAADISGICSTTADWNTKIDELTLDINLRRVIVEKGQNYIHKNHSLNATLERWDFAIGSVL